MNPIREYRSLHPFCEICGRPAVEIHHIKTRGSGGTDDQGNLMALCVEHHHEVHKIGRWSFSEKYELAWENKMVRKV